MSRNRRRDRQALAYWRYMSRVLALTNHHVLLQGMSRGYRWLMRRKGKQYSDGVLVAYRWRSHGSLRTGRKPNRTRQRPLDGRR